MSSAVRCPTCGQSYTVKAELAGKQVTCKKCGRPFRVPAALAAAPRTDGLEVLPDAEPASQPFLSGMPTSTTPLGPASTAPLGPGPSVVLPRKKWKQATRFPVKIVLGLIGLSVGLVLGWVVVDAVFLGRVGWAGGVNGDALAEDGIALMERITYVLSTIRDADSARAAAPQLKDLERQREKFMQDLQVFDRSATSQQRRLMEKEYGGKIQAAGAKMQGEQLRVRLIPGSRAALLGLPEDRLSRLAPSGLLAPSVRISTAPHPAVQESQEQIDREMEAVARRRKERLQELIGQHGAEKVVAIEFDGLGSHLYAWIGDELHQITGVRGFGEYEPQKGYRLTLVPVDDVQALAAKLDYGEITNVDSSRRVIYLKVDSAKVPAKIPSAVTDPKDPRFYEQNLADLTCFDSSRRRSACWNLARVEPNEMQDEIARSLEACLAHRDDSVRRAAAETLAIWGTSENVPALVARLNDEDTVVRSVLDALAVLKDERSVDPVAALLTGELSVRYAAAKCLKKMGAVAESGVAAYVTHAEPDVRRAAVDLLAEIATAKSVPQLVELLTLDDGTAVRKALGALARIKDERAIAPVAELLVSVSTAYYAKECLKAYGPPAQKIVSAYVMHEDTSVRRAAMEILKEIATEESAPALIALLELEDTSTRNEALQILGKIKDERAIVPAAKLLEVIACRGYASKCLIQYGPAAEETVLNGLRHPDPSVVTECCRILQEIGTEKSLDSLRRLTRHKSVLIRSTAQRAGQQIIKRLGPPGKAASEAP